uniref:radical SAM protein n=1 Tax=Candidatus Enterococcus willemsii TaxID=1857215 RepID=UPI00403F77D4
MFFSTYPEIVVNFGKTNLLFYDLINQQKIIMSRDEFPCIESFVNIDLENYPQFMKSFKYLKDNDFGYYLDTPHYNEQILTQKSSILKTDTLNEFTLRRISIELTGRCDLNCVFCNPNDLGYSSCMCKKWNGTETFDNFWLDILTQAIELGIDECFICGGDPLIKMELLQEIICFLNNNNIKITIFTNGVHMSEEFIQYIADKILNV